MAKNNKGKRTQKRDTHTGITVGRKKFADHGKTAPLTLIERHARAWENETRFYLFSQWLGDRKSGGQPVNLTAEVSPSGEIGYTSLSGVANFAKGLMAIEPKPRKDQRTTKATVRWQDPALDGEEFQVHLVQCVRQNPSAPFLEELIATTHFEDKNVSRNLHITPNEGGGFLEVSCGGALLNSSAVLLLREGTGHAIATCALRDLLSGEKRARLAARWARKSAEEAAAEKADAEKATAEKAAAEKAAAQSALQGFMAYVSSRRAIEADRAEARRAEYNDSRWRGLQGDPRLEAAWRAVLGAAEGAVNQWAYQSELVGQIVRPGSPAVEAFAPLEERIGLDDLAQLCDWVLETHSERSKLRLSECMAMCQQQFAGLLPDWVEHGLPAVPTQSCSWTEVKEVLSHPVYAARAAVVELVSLVETTG